jgi:glycosyltransferase involved in cell wall biosynthesis
LRFLYHHRIRGIDGQAVHVRAMLDAFVHEGHEVREVALVPMFPADDRARARRGSATDMAVRSRRPWSWMDHLPRPALEVAELAYSLVAPPMIERAAAEFRPDVIYERYAFGNAGGVLASRRLGVPLVLEVNSPVVDELAAARRISFPTAARRLETFVLHGAALVFVVSEVLRGMVIARGARVDRVIVTQNGVDEDVFRPPLPERRAAVRRELGLGAGEAGDPLCIGFSGFVREWHRLELVLACLARPQLAGARLVVVGEGPSSRSLARCAAELGISERVLLLGARPHEEMPELLGALDIAVVPGIPPYASPLKLHEYLAVGLPVVAPDQGNLREIVTHRDNALLFEPDSADSLAAALTELVADRELRQRLGASARASVLAGGRTWRDVARRVVAAVASLPG